MTTPATAPMTSLDLDSERAGRANARAARQEGRAETIAVVLSGRQVALLGSEFPLDVLQPLTSIDVDLPMIIKTVMSAAKSGAREQNEAALDLIVNVLVVNPSLPADLLAALKEIAVRLLGADGYAALVAWRPTPQDLGALAKGLFGWYGLSLGELTGSSSSSAENDGATSKPTSGSTTTGLTPEGSGDAPALPATPGSPAAALPPDSSEPAFS